MLKNADLRSVVTFNNQFKKNRRSQSTQSTIKQHDEINLKVYSTISKKIFFFFFLRKSSITRDTKSSLETFILLGVI